MDGLLMKKLCSYEVEIGKIYCLENGGKVQLLEVVSYGYIVKNEGWQEETQPYLVTDIYKFDAGKEEVLNIVIKDISNVLLNKITHFIVFKEDFIDILEYKEYIKMYSLIWKIEIINMIMGEKKIFSYVTTSDEICFTGSVFLCTSLEDAKRKAQQLLENKYNNNPCNRIVRFVEKYGLRI